MAFFAGVPSAPKVDENQHTIENTEMILLVRAKQAGLSILEVNEYSIGELFTFIRLFFGAKEDKEQKATQTDIDRMLS